MNSDLEIFLSELNSLVNKYGYTIEGYDLSICKDNGRTIVKDVVCVDGEYSIFQTMRRD